MPCALRRKRRELFVSSEKPISRGRALEGLLVRRGLNDRKSSKRRGGVIG
jgi:hypothetical protein